MVVETQELSYERTHVDWVQFFLARDAFRDLASLLDAAVGSTLNTPLGSLLGDFMIALESRLPDVTEADFSGITEALSAMVAAAAAPSSERWPSQNRKSTSAARSGFGRPFAGICERRPWARRP